MAKAIKLISIGLSYIIGTIFITIASITIHNIIYFIGYVVLCIGIYKILNSSLQFLIKGLKKILSRVIIKIWR